MARLFRISHVFAAALVVCSIAVPVPMECSQEDNDVEEYSTEMIQQQHGFLNRGAGVDELPTPLVWLHVPRTGASFLYTLLQDEALCPVFILPEDLDLSDVSSEAVSVQCPGLLVNQRCHSWECFDHCCENPIGSARWYSEAHGKLVGFFRQPEIRIMSEYNQNRGQKKQGIASFALERQGCITKMLTYSDNQMSGHCGGDTPTFQHVALAKERVETGYVFVGMTDEWNLSICLFNAMFGNTCRSTQFLNYAGHISGHNSSDVSELDGFVDVYDAGLWSSARSIFTKNLRRFGVSDETCQPCSD